MGKKKLFLAAALGFGTISLAASRRTIADEVNAWTHCTLPGMITAIKVSDALKLDDPWIPGGHYPPGNTPENFCD
jgi:hypothetical protein